MKLNAYEFAAPILNGRGPRRMALFTIMAATMPPIFGLTFHIDNH